MFGFAAFSDAGFSSQTTADARIIAGTQVVTGTVAGATILGGAVVVVTTAGSLTSATGTTAQTVIALPATNVVASSIAGVTPETRVIATTAGSMTATVQAMGSEYTLKLVKIPGTKSLHESGPRTDSEPFPLLPRRSPRSSGYPCRSPQTASRVAPL